MPLPRCASACDDVSITHIGGPTVLIEALGWRILTDPTFDAPGRRYGFGWGTSSRKLSGPAIPLSELGPIDAVLLSHDHHGDNLDVSARGVVTSAPSRRHHGVRRQTPSCQCPWADAVAHNAAQGAGAVMDRRDGDALPSRTASQPTARGCGDRLRAAMGRPGARRAVDLG